MKNTRRPRRQKKADRLLNPGANVAEIRCDYATGCFDEEARRMDAKWGVDRLPHLVPQDVADKYARALDALNQAIRDTNPETTAWAAQNCVRGMRRMDEIAEAAGHAKADPHAYVEISDDEGEVYGLLLDERFWPAVRNARPDLTLVTKREAAIAIRFKSHELVAAVDKHFPGSEISAIRPKGGEDNELPF